MAKFGMASSNSVLENIHKISGAGNYYIGYSKLRDSNPFTPNDQTISN